MGRWSVSIMRRGEHVAVPLLLLFLDYFMCSYVVTERIFLYFRLV